MSLREVSSSRPFLAKKGSAAPTKPGPANSSPANSGTARGGSAEPSLRPIESDAEISLESAPVEASVGLAVSMAGKRTAETAPAASLLPFDLLRKKYRPDAVPDLAEDEPDIAPTDFVATPGPEPKQQAELALRVKPEAAAESESHSTADDKPALELKVPPPSEPEIEARLVTPAPSPDPEWRVSVETVIQPERASEKRASGAGWLLPFGALAAAFAALVVGWNMTNPGLDLGFGDLRIGSAPNTVVTSESGGEIAAPTAIEPPPPIAESPAPLADPVPIEPETPAPPENTVTFEPETTISTPLQASLPEPVLSPPADSAADGTAETIGANTPVGPTDPDETAPVEAAPAQPAPALPAPPIAEPTPVKPTVDVVRLEANGEAVIAGRAAPNSELIVLDNGEPIGTARADAFGEWVFVPEAALPIGDHEFGLVVKTVQESVNLPAPSRPSLPPAPALEPALAAPESAPAAPSDLVSDTEANVVPDETPAVAPAVAPAVDGDETATQPIPVPVRKPESSDVSAVPADNQAEPKGTLQEDAPAANTADFVVQLASVKTRAGAEQEWRKLKQKFPEILSNMVPALDEVKLVDYGTVIRVRTGSFDSQRDAATLCAQLAEKRQACLVVKISGGN